MNKRFLFLILNCFTISVIGQTKLVETYNLMPWPQEINKNNNKFVINELFEIKVNNLENAKIKKCNYKVFKKFS